MEVIYDCGSLWHYIWHMQNRENWGEPWENPCVRGMDFGNQAFFERNLLPQMIGWFERPHVAVAVCHRCWDRPQRSPSAPSWRRALWTISSGCWQRPPAMTPGFALVGQLGNLHGNGQTSAILTAVKQWEALRLADRFSDLQRQKLRSADEFHLESIKGGRWQLRPVDFSPRHRLALAGGQAVKEKWEIVNRFTQQPLRFVLRVTAGRGLCQGPGSPPFVSGGGPRVLLFL